MGIEVNADCDECGSNVEGDNVYCESCYDEMKTKLEEAEAKIEELEEQIEECKEGCSECGNRMKCVTNKDKKIGKAV